MKRVLFSLIAATTLAACGGSKPVAPAPAPAPAPAAAPDTKPTPPLAAMPGDIPNSPLSVTIVDLDDKPIAEVAAIVTESANAFDDPLVRGSITGPEGKSDLLIPRDRATFVRGWDPKLNYFANSFLTIDDSDTPLPTESKLIMAPAAALTAQVYGANGAPLAGGVPVEIMFLHPDEGPWWPAHAETDPSGRIVLQKVPAGQFDLGIEAEDRSTKMTGVLLPPRQVTDLGVVKLGE